ncbi:MAG: RNA polymerase sigma factor [Thermoleophilaceae bacterium]|nr:RNA polymerase sigma factor [Thermoleophilaceae bacterium]
MAGAADIDIPASAGALRSRRLLRLAGDDRLVAQIRRGSEAAFEVAFERHAPAILAFCRHMLSSREEAEDAAQHTFAAAYRDLQRGGEREIALRPWLFAIARNRCLSMLRARREQPMEEPEIATAGLAEQVEQRAELRQLLADVRELPDEQRAALLLAEVGGLPQADIAAVLGCEVPRVKALVYRARSALVARREARELPCVEIREQLANLRGGSLRRTELRLHLRECSGCRDFREQVRRQRQMLSVALPVAPTLGLKSSVLAAVGIGGGAAGGGAAVAGGAGALGGIAKVAAVAAIAVGGVAGGTAVVVHDSASSQAPGSGVGSGGEGEGGRAVRMQPAVSGGAATPAAPVRERSRRGLGRVMGRDRHKKRPTHAGVAPPGQLRAKNGRGRATKPSHGQPNPGRGRGAVEAPPGHTPVRRGPAEPKAKAEHGKPAPEVRGQGPQKQPGAPRR